MPEPRPSRAWHWRQAALERRRGEEQAAALWAAYWRRYALDREGAEAQRRLQHWRDRRSVQDRPWVPERGYVLDDPP